MKIIDIVHDYPKGDAGLRSGLCRVRSFLGEGGLVVLLTELDGKNDGFSITNAVERIIVSLQRLGLVLGDAVYLEHYERDSPEKDTYHVVDISSSGAPGWEEIDRSKVLSLIGCHEDDLDERSLDNLRVIAQADRIRYSRNPFADSYHQDRPSVIKRKLEIADVAVSRSEMSCLIEAGAGEREIQSVLKRDLSLFGEIYAQPNDEYICFSEFPLGDGFVDFAVFTGRSRLDVILIEIKSAEFKLVNSDGYGEFNHKINQAAGQLRARLGAVYRDYAGFRHKVHSVRQRAECGESIHGSFLGPRYELHVDPEKDVNIRAVLIGGRTNSDREESAKRHDFEQSFTPSIRVESWDTWLRRLQRQ
ncbi:Shedu immune nuclease family protein [Pseudomonas pseudonitroreducens]|uniref:Shedu immune nuclease family protein n=1 Tax=Pseudomonas pseudonitroreducens TaxID=2892326 RepID=UPI001F20D3BE|nr:Shedu immune nuclease family protein [Pseudomonas pseudonitroreducens]